MEAWKKEMYLAHHGILGQKWGKKNGPPYPLDPEDHSAAEKKADNSYKKNEKRMSKDYSDKDSSLIRKIAKSNYGRHTLAKGAERAYEKAAQAQEKKGKDSKELRERQAAQKKANDDMDEYMKHTSTGRLIVQDLLMGKVQSSQYRAARARGAGRVRALIESSAGRFNILGMAVAASGNKKAYGKALVLGESMDGDWM